MSLGGGGGGLKSGREKGRKYEEEKRGKSKNKLESVVTVKR
jgi:hypothetical protein